MTNHNRLHTCTECTSTGAAMHSIEVTMADSKSPTNAASCVSRPGVVLHRLGVAKEMRQQHCPRSKKSVRIQSNGKMRLLATTKKSASRSVASWQIVQWMKRNSVCLLKKHDNNKGVRIQSNEKCGCLQQRRNQAHEVSLGGCPLNETATEWCVSAEETRRKRCPCSTKVYVSKATKKAAACKTEETRLTKYSWRADRPMDETKWRCLLKKHCPCSTKVYVSKATEKCGCSQKEEIRLTKCS